MDFVFNSPLVPWAIGLVVLYFGWNFVAPRLRIRSPALTADGLRAIFLGDRAASDKTERQAAREMKEGNFLAAGRTYEDAGMLQEAVDAYVKGDELMGAAFALEKMPGKLDQSAEMFLRAGDYKKAAEIWTQNGKPAKAAPLFEEKGNNLEAARLWALAQRWDKAAALFVKSGYPLRAAEAFEKQGDAMKAAESYEKHFMENVTFSTSYSGGAPTSETKNARKAGQLYEQADALEKAREIYLRGSFFEEAAQVSSRLGQFGRAAEYFLRAEDLGAAADAYEQGGDPVKAANYRGEVAFKAGRLAEAAAAFQKGQDYQRSAELFEQIGMLKEAGQAYEDANSFAAAGGVYTRAALKDRAAACYEKAGEYETAAGFYEQVGNGARAAELYEKAGHTFKSGITAAGAGQVKRAISLLQRVPAGDEHYTEATEQLAELFLETGNNALAIERLQKALDGQPIAAHNMGLYYWLARAQEAHAAAEAIRIYKRILSEDFDFKDVGVRVTALETGAPLPAPPKRVAPPAPVAAPAPAARHAAAPKPPRFIVKEEIGRGPLGIVHKAEDTVEKKIVAMRILPAAAPRAKSLVADLKAANAIVHPSFVRVVILSDVQGQRAIVTEYVHGTTLAAAVQAGQKLSVGQVHGIARVVAEALSVVHARGLAHGSIQPSNLMIATGGLRIADLGLGRLHMALVPASPYRAPEGRLDAAGDVYALGATLRFLLSDATVQPGKPSALPAPFDTLVPRCLDPKPEARPKAGEIATLFSAKR